MNSVEKIALANGWKVCGKSRLFGIVADPIAHVQGPTLFNSMFQQRGIDAVMVPFHVSSEDLPDLWFGLKTLRNFGGLLVTIPHKYQAAELCDDLTPMARRVGAVNVVRLQHDGETLGGMFDEAGFIAALKAQDMDPKGKRVLLLGAGGAAAAIAHGLADAGIASLTIYNRSMARADSLAAEVAQASNNGLVYGETIKAGAAATEHIDLVINATALGLKETDDLPIAAESLHAGLEVAEIIMSPRQTRLILAAEKAGCKVLYGQEMLNCQFPLLAGFLGF